MTISLRFQLGVTASAYHAAAALYAGSPIAEPLAANLAGPVDSLREAFAEERVPAETFLNLAIFLAAEFPNPQQLAEVILTKTIGALETKMRLSRFTRLLQEIRLGFRQAHPRLEQDLAGAFQALQQSWQRSGPGLLGGAAAWTDPELLVEEARVLGLQPVLGGAGRVHLASNQVGIEVLEADPDPNLPEVLRLAWMLAQLNLDLPRFTEEIASPRRERVIALAMIPVLLNAAEPLRLVEPDETLLARAVQAWRPEERNNTAVREWWDVYHTMRPTWPSALLALDQLLG